jgi:hypothetical protein
MVTPINVNHIQLFRDFFFFSDLSSTVTVRLYYLSLYYSATVCGNKWNISSGRWNFWIIGSSPIMTKIKEIPVLPESPIDDTEFPVFIL